MPIPTARSCEDEDEVAAARSPVLRMIEPSDFERMRVEWTPGFDARRDKFSKVAAGVGCTISFTLGGRVSGDCVDQAADGNENE